MLWVLSEVMLMNTISCFRKEIRKKLDYHVYLELCNCLPLQNRLCPSSRKVKLDAGIPVSTHKVCSGVKMAKYISQRITKPTKWHVRSAMTQISLGIHRV